MAQVQEKAPIKAEQSVAEPAFQDGDEVTVLYGYGRVQPTHKQYVDDVLFVGGIARNVPYAKARHWQARTRPDGKPTIARVAIQAILPNDAKEADFARVTGYAGMQTDKIAAYLDGADMSKLAAHLGPQRTKELVSALQQYAQK
jgi:hypothetical protein